MMDITKVMPVVKMAFGMMGVKPLYPTNVFDEHAQYLIESVIAGLPEKDQKEIEGFVPLFQNILYSIFRDRQTLIKIHNVVKFALKEHDKNAPCYQDRG